MPLGRSSLENQQRTRPGAHPQPVGRPPGTPLPATHVRGTYPRSPRGGRHSQRGLRTCGEGRERCCSRAVAPGPAAAAVTSASKPPPTSCQPFQIWGG